jgi:protein TIF31
MADTEEPAVTEVTVAMVLPSGKTVVLATGVGATEQVAALPAVLVEGCHTAKYTCFTLEAQDGTPVSELAEIGAYVTGGGGSSSSSSAGGGSGAPTATFVMVPALYDVKKCNVHVARVRDIIQYPPKKLFPGLAVGPLPATPAAADGAAAESAAVALPAAAVRATPAPAPTVEEVFMDVALERFYKDALLRVGATPSAAVRVPADCIKNIAYSGWHPPPANRRAQGDLVYLEVVTADEGTFQLTATPGGFYVNRSTRTAFDPAPAPHAHYSHELLDTILGLSASCRSAWKALSTHALDDEGRRRDPGALDGIAALYVTGHGSDLATNLKPQWNIAAATNFGGPSNSHGNGLSNGHSAATQRAGDRFAHPYSVARAQAAAADLFGMEEPGTLREWNDEVQATRAMVPTALFEKIQRAHIITKIYTEFADAVKAATVAIVDGLVPSVNAHDEEKLRAYMFNNIFYSRATDSKENFRVCGGTEASRKMAAHDLRNQRLIQAAGVPGLCTVLQCVVDFKGDRLIAQNVIPGMLQQGLHPPRLMYGTVEMGKRLSVKKSALATMQAVCGRFYIPTRTITALPQFEPAGSTPDDSLASDAATSAESRLPAMLGAEEGEVPPVAVLEDEDEEDQPAGSATVRHAGCLEVKLLRGSDGRLYALEAMRVTPRDANYVAGAKGTGHVPAALLAHVDPGVAATYVLRLELVESFVQHRLKALRQEVVHDMVRRRQIEDIEKEEKRRAAGKGGASGAAAMTPEEQEAERRDLDRFQKEMAARAEAITAESLQLELNPNVFLEGFECDVDPAVVQKDEITARRLADFLFTAVTDVVEQVRGVSSCLGH